MICLESTLVGWATVRRRQVRGVKLEREAGMPGDKGLVCVPVCSITVLAKILCLWSQPCCVEQNKNCRIRKVLKGLVSLDLPLSCPGWAGGALQVRPFGQNNVAWPVY